ncbi:MAG: TA system VapC family ribonuclease toxin [Opitutaceae bacterium]
MIAVDTNILIYALREDSSFHDSALGSLVGLVRSGDRWSIPWPCVHEFISIATHPRIYSPPTPLKISLNALDAWLGSTNCELLAEGPGYWDTLQQIAEKADCRGSMIHDARIAALCLHHGVDELWSVDRDFSRFPTLKLHNPLQS